MLLHDLQVPSGERWSVIRPNYFWTKHICRWTRNYAFVRSRVPNMFRFRQLRLEGLSFTFQWNNTIRHFMKGIVAKREMSIEVDRWWEVRPRGLHFQTPRHYPLGHRRPTAEGTAPFLVLLSYLKCLSHAGMLLDYCPIIFFSLTKVGQLLIEGVQRSFTMKLVGCSPLLSY